MGKPVPVVGLAGYSGSGKTTFLEKLIIELKSRGYRIGVIKHTHHAVGFDQPGKDTWRHAQAGADFVALAAPGSYSVFKKTERDPGPEILISMAGEMDLVIVEGYKKEKWPKIEVFYRHGTSERPDIPDGELLAVVSDVQPEKDVPHFGLDDAAGVAEYIEQMVLKKV
ncbi:molybdopterin-guanine dinucleotide biosynthesis protein B [Pelotomaculum propionicicum]|uniref:molybdopterin-guanine dinucleotide biosynthesis protein B n=1 Tax=Pelotomaculum propionicicum TaxID=258475 RepID=UPI003B7EB95C